MRMNRFEDVLTGREDNYILPFFWQHGENEKTLRTYMRAIHDSHIGAVCVESRPHPEFAGPKWWKDLGIILNEAETHGMRIWILDDAHFPTGYANGAVLKAKKELHHMYLCSNTVEMAGPRPQIEIPLEDLAHPEKLPPWIQTDPHAEPKLHDDRLYSVLMCPVLKGAVLGKPVSLMDKIVNDRLFLDLPEGYWRIFVVYTTYDAPGRNDYINFLDRESVHLLIDAVYEPHYRQFRKYFGNVIAGFFSDEPPIGNTPGYTMAGQVGTDPKMALAWSREAESRISQSFGSEAWKSYLPYLWGKAADSDMAAKVKCAYMDAVSKLVKECFSDQLGSWCEAHGVEYIGHMLEDVDANSRMGPSMGHYFRGLDGQHMAGIDNIGNSIEIGAQNTGRHDPYSDFEGTFYHYTLGKLAVSAAAIDPKKKGRALCENFGAYGWETGVRTMKYLLDELLIRGVNVYVPHAFSPKAFPDPDCPPHFFAHGENPEYSAFGNLMAYANRVCHLISGGRSFPDVAILYFAESDWAGGAVGNGPDARALSRAQIDYQFLPSDVFSEPEKFGTSFVDNVLRVNKTEYRSLVISGCDYLPIAAASFAVRASRDGFPVVFTQKKPVGFTDASDAALLEELKRLPVVSTDGLADYIRTRINTDVEPLRSTEDLTIYHYDNGKGLYLFLNENPGKAYSGKAHLRKKGKPFLYDPWMNTLLEIPYVQDEQGTLIDLSLSPLELAIVAFDLSFPVKKRFIPGKRIKLEDFSVSKADAKAYPDFSEPVLLHQTEMKSFALIEPDFSGWLRYTCEVELALESESAELEIDDAYEDVRVWVNGSFAGERLTQPFSFDISYFLQKGKNTIQIDVATTLEREAKKLGADVWCMNIHHPLSPTGIVGNVWIKTSLRNQ